MTKKKKELKLVDDQEKFIEKKVKEFKTLEKVKAFYHLDDEVSKYALKVAEGLRLK